jgi:hemerythrin-like domain-containing protein
MKRHSALLTWSREHHAALVLAKRAQRVNESSPDGLNALISQVTGAFVLELEPHFHLEEKHLLPALLIAGQREAVERTLAEHAELRTLAGQLDIHHPEVIRRFGAALAKHVHFEERELFPLAESALTQKSLETIRQNMDNTTRSDTKAERQHEPS